MLFASLYIIVCSARNRLRVRLRRLREPRYLFGAIAGSVAPVESVVGSISAPWSTVRFLSIV